MQFILSGSRLFLQRLITRCASRSAHGSLRAARNCTSRHFLNSLRNVVFAALGVLLMVSSPGIAAESDLNRQLKDVVKEYLAENHPEWRDGIVQLDIVNESKLKADRYKIQVMLRHGQSVLGKFTVPIRYLDGTGKVVGVDEAKCRSQVTVESWVAIQSIKKGDALSTSNCATRNIVITEESINGVKLKLSLTEYSAARPISKGQALQPWMLRSKPVVKSGDTIKVRVVGENIELGVPGVALEDGAIGDTIRIKNLSYQKILSASVEDSQNAVIRVNL